MYVYFQGAGNNRQAWEPIPESQEEQVRRETALHMGIYKLDKLPDGVDKDTIKYKGDLWFDIDHKPASKEPTQADYDAAIYEAILDVRRLLSYFESINLNPKYLRMFASGGKGFHICVPAKMFGATAACKALPLIHKGMVQVIIERCGATGIDTQIYCQGKGHMMRVENKLRENGKYKVPVTFEQIKVMTPEIYADLTSSPIPECINVAPVGICSELAILFSEIQADRMVSSKISFAAVPSAQMEVFSDGNNPACVNWLVQDINVKPGDGKFNRAKMSLARYLMTAPITDAERNRLIDDFAARWHSDRNPTQESRRKAVKETLKYGLDNGFSCTLMLNVLAESPCNNCKLKMEQQRVLAMRSAIDETAWGYCRAAASGSTVRISNFTLRPICRYEEVGVDTSTTFSSFDYAIIKTNQTEPESIGIINLGHKAWQSSAEFKKQISNRMDVSWTGSDIDLQHLKALLTSPTVLKGITTVRHVKTVGIHRLVIEDSGIDEWAWVEENYSISTSGLLDVVRFNGLKQETSGNYDAITVRLGGVAPYDPEDQELNSVIRALFESNTPDVVGPVMGWVFSCWLRSHIRSRETTDKHLPALQLYGSSGHGKTETANLVTVLAGANYINNEPMSIPSSTPYTIKAEASSTTTVPRIFDEMNPHKIAEIGKYSAARDCIKSSARGASLRQASLGDKGVVIDARNATAPLIMLATQLNPEKEIQQRTIPVNIAEELRNNKHSENFRYVQKHVKHLIRLTRTAMIATLHLKMEWIEEAQARNHQLIPEGARFNRIGANWATVLLGLDYMEYVLKYGNAPADILAKVHELKGYVVAWLADNSKELADYAKSQEIDVIINTFGEMIISSDNTGNERRFKHGSHYLIVGDTLHIWSAVFFPKYIQYCRTVLMKVPELTVMKQYESLLKSQPYYLGRGLVSDVPSPQGWDSFSITALKSKGINVENFLEE